MLRIGPQDGGDEDIEDEDVEDDSQGEDSEDEDSEDFRQEDTFQKDVENVEFRVSWLAGNSEVSKPVAHTKRKSHLLLFLVEDELGDEGSTSAAAGTVLRSMVWQTFPEELVEEVLLWLPAAAQARCRAVCKSWRAMLTNEEFTRRTFLQSLLRTTSPSLCVVRYCLGVPRCAYKQPPAPVLRREKSPAPVLRREKSLRVDLSFLPKLFYSRNSKFHNSSPGGLMCIDILSAEGMHVCVFNPVNQSFKVLPILQKLWGHQVALLMGTVTATESLPSFKVYVTQVGQVPDYELQDDAPELFEDVAIYSSITGEWKGFLGGPRPEVKTRGPPAFCWNGDFCTTVHSTPPRLVRLSMQTGLLAQHCGRLLCCCGGIWMLDDARKLWVEIVGRCPPDILPPANPKRQNLFLEKVHVVGDLVFFFYWLEPKSDSRPWNGCAVAYDMRGRFWRKVPHVIREGVDVFCPL